MKTNEMETYFKYLDSLRESGTINMYGAAAYLAEMFDIDNRDEARTILKEWMRTFEERSNRDDSSGHRSWAPGEYPEDGPLRG